LGSSRLRRLSFNEAPVLRATKRFYHTMAAASVLACLGLIGFANALIPREAKVATPTVPDNLNFNTLDQSVDMAAEIASFMGSDAAKTQMLETFCDSASQGQPGHDAVIVVLTPPSPTTWRGGTIFQSFESMKNIHDNNRAEVRLFHDEADHIPKEELEKLFAAARPRRICATKIRFAQFPAGFELHLQHPEGLEVPGFGGWNWNYMHMIRFNFVDLMDPSIGMLAGFKYWMRMDADTQWVASIPDEFQNFEQDGQLGYLSSIQMMDSGGVAAGLQEFTKDFAKSHGINPASLPSVSAGDTGVVLGYYNNLELGRISMFQTPIAMSFTKDLVGNQGIYKHRWGDALLRRIVVELVGMKTSRVKDSTLKNFRHMNSAPLDMQAVMMR